MCRLVSLTALTFCLTTILVPDQLVARDDGRFANSPLKPWFDRLASGKGLCCSFADEVRCLPTGLIAWRDKVIEHKTAIFRQINKDKVATHHDALEFPDGRIALLTTLCEGQQATVLQLPAEPKTAVEAQSQRRVAYIA